MSRSVRGLTNRTVVLTRQAKIGETGGGQPLYGPVDAGLLRARIELAGLGGRSIQPTEVQGDREEAIVADYHAVTELRLELPEGAPEGTLREPANLTERDTLVDPTEPALYEILAVALADARHRAHHYECKLRKVTP